MKEADIVAEAGKPGTVTATNMAVEVHIKLTESRKWYSKVEQKDMNQEDRQTVKMVVDKEM